MNLGVKAGKILLNRRWSLATKKKQVSITDTVYEEH